MIATDDDRAGHTRRRPRSSRAVPLLLLALAVGCATKSPPRLEALLRQPDRVPVVLVPGMTGTVLRDETTGKIVWGDAKRLFFPRDGGHSLALPLGGERDGIVPVAPILRIKLFGLFGQDAYGPVLETMAANGFRIGDLDDPRPQDDFFVLDYDWRQDTPTVAAALERRLERLRAVRGDARLPVRLICQSNAALICRYFARHGGATLDRAEAGAARDGRVAVDAMILVGAPNGGGLRILRELNRGRRYTTLAGRRFRPETLFSFRSIYETLPAYMDDLFVDADGRPLAVDLWDAETWRRHGWSVFDERTASRLRRDDPRGRFGAPAERQRFLAERLERARRLHRLLRRDPPGFRAPRLHLIQDGYLRTPQRAVLFDGDGRRPATAFAGDRAVARDPVLRSRTTAPGDGHATLESILWLSPGERDALAGPPVHVEGGHFGVILKRAAQRQILEWLAR